MNSSRNAPTKTALLKHIRPPSPKSVHATATELCCLIKWTLGLSVFSWFCLFFHFCFRDSEAPSQITLILTQTAMLKPSTMPWKALVSRCFSVHRLFRSHMTRLCPLDWIKSEPVHEEPGLFLFPTLYQKHDCITAEGTWEQVLNEWEWMELNA